MTAHYSGSEQGMRWGSSSGSAQRISGGVELLDGISMNLGEDDEADDGGSVGAVALDEPAGSVRSDDVEVLEGTTGSVESA